MGAHAEIAGAGFAGLVAAVALLDRGWTVRVHERTPLLRGEGFGIALHENGIRVLEAIGVFDRAASGGLRISRLETRDERGRTTALMTMRERSYRISRQHLVQVLGDRIRELGGELRFNSSAVGALGEGVLLTEDGGRFKADLVIGADGANSRVRDSLGLLRRRTLLGDGAMRLVIPRRPEERAGDPADSAPAFENWSGHRRIIYSACSADQVYIALSCLNRDRQGQTVPIDRGAWAASFPRMTDIIERVSAEADWSRVQWARFHIVKLRRWSEGRVAILGDAANAMPPNLGQGGGVAMMNALALAVTLEQTADVPQALQRWEARERPLTEHTQRWSQIYSWTTRWPNALRNAAFAATARSAWLTGQIRRTATHIPTGCEPVGV